MTTDYTEVWQILSESTDPPDALEAYVARKTRESVAQSESTLAGLRRVHARALERLGSAYSLGAWGELVEERNKARALMMNAEGVAAGETYLREQAEEKLAAVKCLLDVYGDPEDGEEPRYEFLVSLIDAVLSDSDRMCGCPDEGAGK